MKHFIILSFIFILFSCCSKAQITKSNWLMGGDAYYSSTYTKGETSDNKIKFRAFRTTPNVGYFIIDKLALGIGGIYDYTKVIFTSGSSSKSSYWGIGPFIRYYFLPVDRQLNIFSEGSYNMTFSSNNNAGAITFKGGPVFFLNSIVGVELTGSYSHANSNEIINNGLRIGVGFQIHLERE